MGSEWSTEKPELMTWNGAAWPSRGHRARAQRVPGPGLGDQQGTWPLLHTEKAQQFHSMRRKQECGEATMGVLSPTPCRAARHWQIGEGFQGCKHSLLVFCGWRCEGWDNGMWCPIHNKALKISVLWVTSEIGVFSRKRRWQERHIMWLFPIPMLNVSNFPQKSLGVKGYPTPGPGCPMAHVVGACPCPSVFSRHKALSLLFECGNCVFPLAGLLQHGDRRRWLDGHSAPRKWQCWFSEVLERV